MTTTTVTCPPGLWTQVATGAAIVTIQGPSFGYRVAVGASAPTDIGTGLFCSNHNGQFSITGISATENIYVAPIGPDQINVAVVAEPSGTPSLPTGAATAAKQDTINATLTTMVGQLPATLGQKTMANSQAVVLASDQSAIKTAGPNAIATTSTPLAGTASATATVGPFTPQLGRAIVLSLSGTWGGSVALLRSVDGGTTKLPATMGGTAMTWTANLCEPVTEEGEAAATYYLGITIASGTLTYRMAQ